MNDLEPIDLTIKQKLAEFEISLGKKLSVKELNLTKLNEWIINTLYKTFDEEIKYQEQNQEEDQEGNTENEESERLNVFTVEEDKVKQLVKKARRRSFDRQLGLRNLMPELSSMFGVDVENL